MTEQPPYTDNDCRHEAARQLRRINDKPNGVFPEPLDGDSWADVTGPDYDNAIDRVASLMNGAPDMTNWAVDLGADDLKPSEFALTYNGPDRPAIRIHFAFAADITYADQAAYVASLASVMAANHT